MLFNSFGFIFLFLPITLWGYFLLGRYQLNRWAGCWLTVASLVFYGVWNVAYLALIIGSILGNYLFGVWIHKARKGRINLSAKLLLTIGVSLNLIVLGYYKYANFFVDTCGLIFGVPWHLHTILLPLAISFFTFTQIAYLVDAYHGVTEEYDFLHYALFVSFFPHLIAGPIVSYRRLMPQFAKPLAARFNAGNLAAGFSLFSVGLAKKVLIADNLAPLSQVIFDSPGLSPALVPAWIGALGYTFQLYFDFSAYSDMAIGLAYMFNVRFPVNFNSPYKALDISDFWRRWHMTLSHFLRDHVYIPLGGNRHGELRRYLNLSFTMLVGGFWHGAGWTFIIWGGLHGLYMVIHHLWERRVQGVSWLQASWCKMAGGGLTFLCAVIGWVFFRSHSLPQAGNIISGMAGSHGLGLPAQLAPLLGKIGLHEKSLFATLPGAVSYTAPLICLFLAIIVSFLAPNADQIFRIAEQYSNQGKVKPAQPIWKLSPGWAVVLGIILGFSIFNLSRLSEFLYFRF